MTHHPVVPAGSGPGAAAARALLDRSAPTDETLAPGERLRRHGLALCRALLQDHDQTTMLAGHLSLDRPDPDLLAIRRLALGWAMDAPAGGDGVEEGFAAALDALLRGFATRVPVQPRLLYARLWTLISAAREGADLVYSRAGELPELARRILLILYSGDRVLKDVTAMTGVDKAQVSRAVKRLSEAGLVARTTIRQPIALTPNGRATTLRLIRLFATRSRALVHGLAERDLAGFFTGLDEVSARAVALFEAERARDGTADRLYSSSLPPDLMSETTTRGTETIVSRLLALLSYIQRSAALSYRRLLGVSHFEAWVLAEIARDPPLDWAQLSAQIARDGSQAARTVRRLVELDLVEHDGVPGRRQGLLRPTEAGARAAAVIEEEQWRRDRLLVEGIEPDTLRAFLFALDRMTWNVQAQLVRDLAQRAEDGPR